MRTMSMTLAMSLALGLAYSASAVELFVPAGVISARAPSNNSNSGGDGEFPDGWLAGIEQTIDGSGFDASAGTHFAGGFRADGGTFWLGEGSASPGGQPPNNAGGLNPGSIINGNVWGAWDFDPPQEIVDVAVWNYGGCCGRGFNTVTVEAEVDGTFERLFLGQLLDRTADCTWCVEIPDTDPVEFETGFGPDDMPVELLSSIGAERSTDLGDGGGQAYVAPSGLVSSIVFTAGDAPGGPLSDGTVFDTNHGGSGNIGLSEIRFVVPEPATIGLLTLGGLAMLRRRRA